DSPLEAAGQFLDLTDKSHRSASFLVGAHIFHRYAKRPRVAFNVEVVAVGKRLDLPLFAGKPSEYATFNVGQVSAAQLLSRCRNQCTAHRRPDHVHGVVVNKFHSAALDRLHREVVLILQVLRYAAQVLQLHEPTGPAVSAAGTAELKRAAQATVAGRCAQK